MGVWKSLVDGMKEKRDELARRAAKKAARTAVSSAGKMVDGVSKAIEDALFGEGDAEAKAAAPEATTDPFAKLKAAETEKKEREREERRVAKERAAAHKKVDREVDAELAALKKKLGK